MCIQKILQIIGCIAFIYTKNTIDTSKYSKLYADFSTYEYATNSSIGNTGVLGFCTGTKSIYSGKQVDVTGNDKQMTIPSVGTISRRTISLDFSGFTGLYKAFFYNYGGPKGSMGLRLHSMWLE